MFGNAIGMARRRLSPTIANRDAGSWKRLVAFGSFLTTLALTLGKFIAGLVSGSVALMSDAVQGIADIAVTLVTLYTVSVSDRPACPRYTYGRQKFEAFASLIESALLFIFGCVIVFMGMVRLLVHSEPVRIEPWLLSIVAVTALADLWRHLVLQRCARATGSIALGANAMHFLADALSSAIVFVSLILVWAGFEAADLIATFLIAAILFRMTWRTYDHGSRALCDSVDPQVSWDVHEIVSQELTEAGEAPLRSLRLRLVPGTWFVEAVVGVPQDTPLVRVEQWRRTIAARLTARLGPVEFLLQPDPIAVMPVNPAGSDPEESPDDADRGSSPPPP
ncbi:MAG: cation transporter [Salinarimonas sp.]|nr:cation transporter [Salinarimonas sp.]